MSWCPGEAVHCPALRLGSRTRFPCRFLQCLPKVLMQVYWVNCSVVALPCGHVISNLPLLRQLSLTSLLRTIIELFPPCVWFLFFGFVCVCFIILLKFWEKACRWKFLACPVHSCSIQINTQRLINYKLFDLLAQAYY